MSPLRFGLMALALWMATAFALPASAQVAPGPHVDIALVAETDTPASGGDVTLGFVSRPHPGWHAYWQNPGDAGFPPTLAWTLPEGASAGAMQFPVPQTLTIAGLMNYVYEAPFTPLVQLKIPQGLAPGTKVPVAVRYDYLVCTDKICVPENAELRLDLTIGDGRIDPASRTRFDGWRAALPKPLGSPATYQVDQGRFRIAIPFPASAEAGQAYFFPLSDGAIQYAAPQTFAREGDRLVIETKARSPKGRVDGVLSIGDGRGFVVHAEPGTVTATAAAQPLWIAIAVAFGGAVLGGLLLNVMPCVFPILSLKALSLAKANAGEGKPRAEALAYTAGVVLVCLALGGALLALRAGGASLGWAFQLQDPRVILVLLLLVAAIAFNLAGLFEMSAPGIVNRLAAGGTGGAFLTGALAAFIATPCSGPFMGAALGAALVLPWIAALAVFAGLGLGIALPFLLLGFVPALRRRLPRPGAWMATLRRILSVPMFATALALAWVLGQEAGITGMTIGLGATLLAALGLWWVGLRQARGVDRQWLPALPLLLIALAAAALVKPQAPAAAAVGVAGAEPFSESRLAALRAEGRPVFAYFTADWCLTCKVNEKAVIETQSVTQALSEGKVAVMVGDWTDGDPVLGRFIESHNRAGVPLYLWYAPGAETPQVLPQILTQGMIRELAAGPR